MQKLPVVVIVGRPNVGKSTLFNTLTQTRKALVADMPGVTRDRQYGEVHLAGCDFIIVDTGGIAEDDDVFTQLADSQVQQALQQADVVLFMVDAKQGMTAADEAIAERLRKQYNAKTHCVVNKVDRDNADVACAEFYALGFVRLFAIAAKSARGVKELIKAVLPKPVDQEPEETSDDERIHIAFIGRPNVGKSTLVNRMLGEERVVVYDAPGTTRDSVDIPFDYRDKKYTLIDTAGVRRRAKVDESIEKFSVIKSIQAIKRADVVVAVLDASEDIVDQDLHLIGLVLEMGTALIIAINKWDGLDDYHRDQIKQAMDRRLSFVNFARRYFISALHGTGVGKLYHAIDEAYAAAMTKITTSDMNKALEKALQVHQPPLASGRRIRLRYAHLAGHNPFVIVIHGKQTTKLPMAYKRYLMNFFRERYKLVGVPIHIEFKDDENPFVS